MNRSVITWVHANEEHPHVRSRDDLATSYIESGPADYNRDEALSIIGTSAERATFLAELAAACSTEAYRLQRLTDEAIQPTYEELKAEADRYAADDFSQEAMLARQREFDAAPKCESIRKGERCGRRPGHSGEHLGNHHSWTTDSDGQADDTAAVTA